MKNDEFIVSGDTTKSFSGGQKLFGRYKLSRLLGRGGMGVVWLAHDDELDREVALKFLPAMFINDRASLDDLKRETKRSLELTHPNIVRTYDFVQDNETAGISMEYVDADTLRNRRIDEPSGVFEPAVMGEWVVQLCNALDYAHHHGGIVHRDLKPANLMVNKKNHLKVADFGISRSLAESSTQITGKSGVSGTLVYMSPQQLSGEDATATDDVYSVGATIYELCTTRPPFYVGDISGQILRKVAPSMTDRRLALGVAGGQLPQNWETTIASCLAKDPADRPQSAGEIAVRLGLIEAAALSTPRPASPATAGRPIIRPANTTPPPPAPPSPPSTTAPLTSPHPAPAGKFPKPVLLAVLAVAFGIVIGLVLHFGSKRPQLHPSTASTATVETKSVIPEKPVPAQAEVSSSAIGSILVNTDPPEAIVQIGDAPPNTEKKPTVLKGVKVGHQSMTVSREGYEPVTVQVDVVENQTSNPDPIKLVRSTGKLRIVSKPPGLVYELRSKSDPTITPKHGTATGDALTGLPTGEYEVTVTRENWKPQPPQTVTVTKEGDPEVYFDFPTGKVNIVSVPPGAIVVQAAADPAQIAAMERVQTGAGPNQTGSGSAPVTEGPAQAETGSVQAGIGNAQPGVEPAATPKKLTQREKEKADQAMEKATQVEEEAAFKAGKNLGVPTPQSLELPPGPVRYFLMLKGYDRAVVTGEVKAGAELSLTATLKKTVTKSSGHRGRRGGGGDDDDDRGHGGHEGTSEKVFKWLNFFRGG